MDFSGRRRRYTPSADASRQWSVTDALLLGLASSSVATLVTAPIVQAAHHFDQKTGHVSPADVARQTRQNVIAAVQFDATRGYLGSRAMGTVLALQLRESLTERVVKKCIRRGTRVPLTFATRYALENTFLPRSSGTLVSPLVNWAWSSVGGAICASLAYTVSYPLHYDPYSTTETLHFFGAEGKGSLDLTLTEMGRRMYLGFPQRLPGVAAQGAVMFGAFDALVPMLPAHNAVTVFGVAWAASTAGLVAKRFVTEVAVPKPLWPVGTWAPVVLAARGLQGAVTLTIYDTWQRRTTARRVASAV